MYETKIDLKHNVREAMVQILNARLADAIDLRSQLKQAHWNVKGLNFIALHELFDKIADETLVYVDDIAERATALGGTAIGTVSAVKEATSLPEFPLDIASGEDHLKAVQASLAAFAAALRQAIDDADEAGDKDTADLFTGISRDIDKSLWLVEAHLQG